MQTLNARPDKLSDSQQNKWYQLGYASGMEFAENEADYDELAAIARAGGIPAHWDIFRAEIVNQYLYDPLFDFKAYSTGFGSACADFYKNI